MCVGVWVWVWVNIEMRQGRGRTRAMWAVIPSNNHAYIISGWGLAGYDRPTGYGRAGPGRWNLLGKRMRARPIQRRWRTPRYRIGEEGSNIQSMLVESADGRPRASDRDRGNPCRCPCLALLGTRSTNKGRGGLKGHGETSSPEHKGTRNSENTERVGRTW